jgi:hypothetical protein
MSTREERGKLFPLYNSSETVSSGRWRKDGSESARGSDADWRYKCLMQRNFLGSRLGAFYSRRAVGDSARIWQRHPDQEQHHGHHCGNEYEGVALQMTGEAQPANSEDGPRPEFCFANPEGAFSPATEQGKLNKATVVRRRVLYQDLFSNTNVYSQNSWTISRGVALNKQIASFELWGVGDIAFFVCPNRKFVRPPSRRFRSIRRNHRDTCWLWPYRTPSRCHQSNSRTRRSGACVHLLRASAQAPRSHSPAC